MNYKVERAIKKSRKYFMSFAILWLVLTIVFVAPLSCTIVDSTVNNQFDLTQFLEKIGPNVTNVFGNLANIFNPTYTATFFDVLIKYTIGFIVVMIIGIIKMAPKNEYSDIEHGSSDWSENGEQYKVLSKKNGIILAEENYLPLDKRGNINVLIVGRIRFW